MALHSTRWLALSYFTYFFSYGIFSAILERLAQRSWANTGNYRSSAGRGSGRAFSR